MDERPEVDESVPSSPTWSVATVLTFLVTVSLFVERGIHRLSSWLKRTNRRPLYDALEKMKEELMLLGFMSLFLTATSRIISSICIESKLSSRFVPCTKSEIYGTRHDRTIPTHQKQSMQFALHHSIKRLLNDLNHHTCEVGRVPFTSNEVLEQLDRFIFVMAITHVFYSCLTLLLAGAKIHTWRKWEDEAHREQQDSSPEAQKASKMRRQSTLIKFHPYNPWGRNRFLLWVTCFIRQFGSSVGRTDYLTVREAFVMNHNLALDYDFHSYMIRSMEDEFKTIVGISVPLWGFIICFMLFDVKGSNLYFWVAIIPATLVLLVGAKLQHIIAILTLENSAVTGFFSGTTLRPRDDLFWFKKPELVLSLIHFVLFQNAFELASFFWLWWQFGYESCLFINHWAVHVRLTLGFAGQFLCSYSKLPLHALVTQMGSNYKAALIPPRVREMVRDWGATARRRRKRRLAADESTTITESDTNCSIEERQLTEDAFNTCKLNNPEFQHIHTTLAHYFSTDHGNSRRGTGAPFLPRELSSLSEFKGKRIKKSAS